MPPTAARATTLHSTDRDQPARHSDGVDGLLVKADGEIATTRVDAETGDGIATALGCRRAERWYYQYMLDAVSIGDRTYRYDVWVDAEARAAGRPDNLCASLAAHPLNGAYGWLVAGDALLVSVDPARPHMAVADWSAIQDAVCHDRQAVEANCQGPDAYVVRVLG